MPWGQSLAKIANDHQLRVEPLSVRGGARPCFWVTRRSSPPAPQTEFAGAPVAVRFDETPIRSAVATLAEAGKTQIVVDDGVEADVTLHLRQIPWDLALYHLAQKYGLRIVRGADVIHVARH